MGSSGPAVVPERAEEWIGVDLVAGPSQEAAGVITADVITVRNNGIENIRA